MVTIDEKIEKLKCSNSSLSTNMGIYMKSCPHLNHVEINYELSNILKYIENLCKNIIDICLDIYKSDTKNSLAIINVKSALISCKSIVNQLLKYHDVNVNVIVFRNYTLLVIDSNYDLQKLIDKLSL